MENINRREEDEGTTEEQGFFLWQGVDDVEISNEICSNFFSLLMELLDKILRCLDSNLSVSPQCAVVTKESCILDYIMRTMGSR